MVAGPGNRTGERVPARTVPACQPRAQEVCRSCMESPPPAALASLTVSQALGGACRDLLVLGTVLAVDRSAE